MEGGDFFKVGTVIRREPYLEHSLIQRYGLRSTDFFEVTILGRDIILFGPSVDDVINTEALPFPLDKVFT